MKHLHKLSDKRLLFSIGISVFFIYLLFQQLTYNDLLEAVKAFSKIKLIYLAPAVALTLLSYYTRAFRWKILLSPLKSSTSMGNLFPATVIGFMANIFLPARLGEVVRAYVLGEKEGIDKRSVFATLVLDRLLDGFTVLLMLLVLLFTLKLPPGKEGMQRALTTGGYVTLVIYLAVVVLLILLKKNWSRSISLVERICSKFSVTLGEKVVSIGNGFFSGLAVSENKRHPVLLLISSVVVWGLATWPIDLILLSFGINLPFTGSMLIMVLLVVAVIIPAPGHVGLYEWACYQALAAFNVPAGTALSISLILRSVGFFPVIILGVYYLWRDKISLRSVKYNPNGGE